MDNLSHGDLFASLDEVADSCLEICSHIICDPIYEKVPFPHILHGSEQYAVKSDS